MFKSYFIFILQFLFASKTIMIGIYSIVLALLLTIANIAKTANSFFGAILYANQDFQARYIQCIVQSGLNLVTEVIQSNIESIYEFDVDILYKAKTMFKAMDYVYISCRSRDPVEQAKQFMSKLPSQLWSTVWIMLQTDAQCNAGSYSKVENCDYIKKMLQQFSRNNIVVGVVTYDEWWEYFVQGQCKQIGSYPLYWLEFDQNPFFTNFVPFGGWTQPKAKIYSSARICGIEIALTYRKQLDVHSLD